MGEEETSLPTFANRHRHRNPDSTRTHQKTAGPFHTKSSAGGSQMALMNPRKDT